MTTPEQAREIADWYMTQNGHLTVCDALRDLARQVEELQADAERWRRLVNASEMEFPVLAIADDPENDCFLVFGRGNMEEIVDMMDEIPATYGTK